MENLGGLNMFLNVYQGRRVFITGHTGFKGSWLTSWLLKLGAIVAGYSREIPTQPSHFEILGLQEKISHYEGDICDSTALQEAIDDFRPNIVFHLAAQALVRESYNNPVETFQTNTVGTMMVLEALRHRPWIGAAVMITSDKAYRNTEWLWGYRENDALGGEDPYSSSKGCAELVFYSYFESFLKHQEIQIASTRAGNVIGGGDWARDRIIPDSVQAWSKKDPVVLRNPQATRPWQHVLEPLSGYLLLGAHLWKQKAKLNGESFNFGPVASTVEPVIDLIQKMSNYWPGSEWQVDAEVSHSMPEAGLLKLCCDKALHLLNWSAVLSFEETAQFTGEWYRKFYEEGHEAALEQTEQQIEEYTKIARTRGQKWTQE